MASGPRETSKQAVLNDNPFLSIDAARHFGVRPDYPAIGWLLVSDQRTY